MHLNSLGVKHFIFSIADVLIFKGIERDKETLTDY